MRVSLPAAVWLESMRSFSAAGFMVNALIFASGTVTVHEAVAPLPSFAVAVTVASPMATAVTRPVSSTVATAGALLVQVTVLSAASSGTTVATVSEAVSVTSTVRALSLSVRDCTFTGTTVTAHSAVAPLSSWAVAVTVAVPRLWPVTVPFASTVAMSVWSLCQLTVRSLAKSGSTVAVRETLRSFSTSTAAGSTVTSEESTVTLTAQVSVLPPSAVVTVMTASPLPTAVTRPVSSTVATAGALLVQVTLWLSALAGSTAALSRAVTLPLSLPRSVSASSCLSSETPLTGTDTWIVFCAVTVSRRAEAAVMTAVPEAWAVTLPVLSTVATVSSLLLHVTSRKAPAGSTEAVRAASPPGLRSASPPVMVMLSGSGRTVTAQEAVLC